ncbi:MAG: hypothetical protein U9O98_03325 [Asgard group archaeon]|nr:hypothetical protein [Asgard group archaeon]
MPLLTKADAYLIKVDSSRKNYVPSKTPVIPKNPIFAEDVILHNRFILPKNEITKNPDFKKVQQNDYIVVFCSSLVPHSPKQIKFIYRVKSKIQNKIILKKFTKLQRGYSFKHLVALCKEGQLSSNLQKALTEEEHKITQIQYSDVELLVNFDPIVRTYHSSSWKT